MTSIDDSGGGDGVEFYLTLPDQTEYGWQAKYYEGNPVRLSASRKTKIKDSLKKSPDLHPKMTDWFLCLPMFPTVEENKWIKGELRQLIPDDRKVEIVPWHEDELHGFLNRPEFNGLKQAFFNELELSSDRFNSRFANLSVIVEKKFDEESYTENSEFFYWYVNPILINADYKENRIAYYPRKLRELNQQGIDAMVKLHYTNEKFLPLFNHALEEFEKITNIYLQIQPQLDERLNQLCPNRIFETSNLDFSGEVDKINDILNSWDGYRRN